MTHTANVKRANDGEYWLTIVGTDGEVVVDEEMVHEDVEDALSEHGYALVTGRLAEGGDESGWPVEWVGP